LQISGSFQCPLCQKVYKYEYNLFYHWRRTCHELSELIPAERRKTMDVNVLRSMVLKFARKKADEAPPPVMKIGINPNLLFKSDTFGLIDMQAPLIYKYEYNLFYHWRRTCHELSELIPAERRKTMDVNVLRSMVLKFARKKADEAPPPVMKIGINPNLLFKSDTFGLIDMQAPLSTQSVYSGVPCKQCGVKISNSVIQWHVAMHRGIIPVDARSGSGEHFCSLCGQMFRQHYSLIKHWRSSCTEIQ
uniref:C2H2-type domain-containing protein n=1 Tax=Brugia pahangi TaxID=6280 RepID=A0A0N4U0B1_BRUPA